MNFLREKLYRHALEYLKPDRSEKQNVYFFASRETPQSGIHDVLKACGWRGHNSANSASIKTPNQNMAMSRSSAVHGGQYDTKCVVFAEILDFSIVRENNSRKKGEVYLVLYSGTRMLQHQRTKQNCYVT